MCGGARIEEVGLRKKNGAEGLALLSSVMWSLWMDVSQFAGGVVSTAAFADWERRTRSCDLYTLLCDNWPL